MATTEKIIHYFLAITINQSITMNFYLHVHVLRLYVLVVIKSHMCNPLVAWFKFFRKLELYVIFTMFLNSLHWGCTIGLSREPTLEPKVTSSLRNHLWRERTMIPLQVARSNPRTFRTRTTVPSSTPIPTYPWIITIVSGKITRWTKMMVVVVGGCTMHN